MLRGIRQAVALTALIQAKMLAMMIEDNAKGEAQAALYAEHLNHAREAMERQATVSQMRTLMGSS